MVVCNAKCGCCNRFASDADPIVGFACNAGVSSLGRDILFPRRVGRPRHHGKNAQGGQISID
jgi:hypothetical protein